MQCIASSFTLWFMIDHASSSERALVVRCGTHRKECVTCTTRARCRQHEDTSSHKIWPYVGSMTVGHGEAFQCTYLYSFNIS